MRRLLLCAALMFPAAAFAQTADSSDQWAASAIAQLSAQVMAGHHAVAKLEAENAALKADVAKLKAPANAADASKMAMPQSAPPAE